MIGFTGKFISLKDKYPKERFTKTIIFEGLVGSNPAKDSWCGFSLRSKVADGGLKALRYNLISSQDRRRWFGRYAYIGKTQKRRTRLKLHVLWKKG